MIYRRVVLLPLALCLFFSASLSATTRLWTGAASANWSNTGNWSPSGTPSVSDSLVFPAGALNGSMTNDLPAGTAVGPMTFQAYGYTLSGNALTLMGNLNSQQGGFTCNVDLKIGRDLTIGDGGFGSSVFNGAIDINGQTLTSLLGIASRLIGPLNGTGAVMFSNRPSIEGNGTFAGTLSGYVRVFGSLPNATVVGSPQIGGSAVSGVGTLGNVTVEGAIGYLAPGNKLPYEIYTRGVLHTKSLVVNAAPNGGTTFDLEPGGVSDQVQVSGTVTLSGLLNVNIVSGTPTPGQTFTIIDNDAADAVNGTFTGLPEGSVFDAGTSKFSISYHGGDGNNVVLTVLASQKKWTGAVSALWSEPQNWLPQVSPVAGEPLVFPDGALHGSMTNDLLAGTAIGSMTFQAYGYTLSGNALTLMGDLNSQQGGFTCNVDLKIGRDLTIGDGGFGSSVFNGAIDVNGQTLTSLLGIASRLIGPLNGTGAVMLSNRP
jgi:hypothetical protein